MPRFRATIIVKIKGVLELEAEDEEAVEKHISEEVDYEDVLPCQPVIVLIEDIECLDDDEAD